VTLKLRSFPLAYWSVLFYFADFIRRAWDEKQWRRATGFFGCEVIARIAPVESAPTIIE